MALRIKVHSPDSQPVLRSLDKPEIVIGRKPSHDLVLAGKDVSSTHASIQVVDGRVTLTDLGSLNGTFVNGNRIDVAELSPTDEVTISTFRLSVALVEPTPAPGPTNPRPPPAGDAPPDDQPPPPVRCVRPAGDAPSPPPLADDEPPPPIRRRESVAMPPADDGLPPLVQRSARASEPQTPVPVVEIPPVVQRSALASEPQTPVPPAVSPAPATGPADLAQALADPTIRRIVFIGPRIEVERDGVRLPLGAAPLSLDALHTELATLCGRPLPREAPTACVLTDGTGVQTSPAAEHGFFAVLTRPARRRSSLDALVQDQVLPSHAAELLSACARARLPVLLAGLGGVWVAPLLTALLGATPGPSSLIRGLPAPTPVPRHCTAFDASTDIRVMPAQIRLALAAGPTWLAVDEPDATALEECAWGAAAGHGLLIGVRAESLRHALERARLTGLAGCPAPSIPYAVVALLEHSGDTGVRTAFRLHQLLEVLHDDSGAASPREILTTGRRHEFITTAVPMLLDTLRARGFHLGADMFTPS